MISSPFHFFATLRSYEAISLLDSFNLRSSDLIMRMILSQTDFTPSTSPSVILEIVLRSDFLNNWSKLFLQDAPESQDSNQSPLTQFRKSSAIERFHRMFKSVCLIVFLEF